jgi:hypothetical protein
MWVTFGQPGSGESADPARTGNEGTSQEVAHGQVTSLLKKMTKAPTNLRAVIGMGVSVTPTIAGAQALGDAGIPMKRHQRLLHAGPQERLHRRLRPAHQL